MGIPDSLPLTAQLSQFGICHELGGFPDRVPRAQKFTTQSGYIIKHLCVVCMCGCETVPALAPVAQCQQRGNLQTIECLNIALPWLQQFQCLVQLVLLPRNLRFGIPEICENVLSLKTFYQGGQRIMGNVCAACLDWRMQFVMRHQFGLGIAKFFRSACQRYFET